MLIEEKSLHDQQKNPEQKKQTGYGDILSWKMVKWFRFKKEKPNEMQYKNKYMGVFITMKTVRRGAIATHGSNKKTVLNKFLLRESDDFQQMGHSKDVVIPKDCYEFYKYVPIKNTMMTQIKKYRYQLLGLKYLERRITLRLLIISVFHFLNKKCFQVDTLLLFF